jgi:hypothetical protein
VLVLPRVLSRERLALRAPNRPGLGPRQRIAAKYAAVFLTGRSEEADRSPRMTIIATALVVLLVGKDLVDLANRPRR